MKWHTEWWGIYFEPENDKDRQVLNGLIALLPEKAEHRYEDGRFAWDDEYKVSYMDHESGEWRREDILALGFYR